MMLMTKFGKFKLRLIATINLSVLLTLFNIASTTSNYWVRYLDHENGLASHVAGLWRSCSIAQGGSCMWKNGIVSSTSTAWSILVRLLIFAGTLGNVAVVLFLMLAFYYKINKRSKLAIQFMEGANGTLIVSFIAIFVGFTLFISNKCNYSMWLFAFSMVCIAVTSNMLTRTFARMYYANTTTRGGKKVMMMGQDVACSSSKLEPGCVEEKLALACNGNTGDAATIQMTAIEMNKISEANGSNEALLPTTTVTIGTNTTVAEMVNSATCTTTVTYAEAVKEVA